MNDLSMRHCDLAVLKATVLPGNGPALVGCDIVVQGGHITAMGPGAADGLSAPAVIDGRSLLITPGLCNGHTHSPETLARGLGDGTVLSEWFASVWSRMDRLDDDAIRLGVLLGAAEMLHGGATAVVDHFRQTPIRPEAVDSAARAWLESGMRATMALMVRDRAVPDWVEGALSAAAQVDIVAACAERWHDPSGRLRVALGPSAANRASDALLRAGGALCRGRGIGMHMHVDETREEAARSHEEFGVSSVGRLHELDVLGPHVSLAHCVWCDDDDLDLLAASGAAVVHNPVSNMRLGSGRAPVRRMLDKGVRVTLGTDGAASNDTQNMLEAVKYAALLPRAFSDDPANWVSAQAALSMATTNAGAAFGMSDGRLAPGCAADFAAFDLDALPLVPLNDPCAQLVFAGAAVAARHVVIGGRVVVDDGVIQAFDEGAVVAAARERFAR